MARLIGVFIIGIVLTACTTAKQITTPDGRTGYSVTCNGTAQNWGDCYEKAGQICGGSGYNVIAGGAEQGAVVSGGQYGVFGGSTMNRNMIIQCKG